MGRRSNFKRIDRDAYLTWDQRAYPPLLRHLPRRTSFIEPCAGRADLMDGLEAAGHSCVLATDIRPMDERVFKSDILRATPDEIRMFGADMIITNPPWRRSFLHRMIPLFSDVLPTWLLFDVNWLFTQQSAKFLPRLRKVVAIGRLRWIEGTSHDGVDDCAWYLFDKPSPQPPRFYGRVV